MYIYIYTYLLCIHVYTYLKYIYVYTYTYIYIYVCIPILFPIQSPLNWILWTQFPIGWRVAAGCTEGQTLTFSSTSSAAAPNSRQMSGPDEGRITVGNQRNYQGGPNYMRDYFTDLWCVYATVNVSAKWFTGWWYTYPSQKYESQLGLLFPIYGKYGNIIQMFQTTKQFKLVS